MVTHGICPSITEQIYILDPSFDNSSLIHAVFKVTFQFLTGDSPC